ncbi:phage tail sheath subtilisin-like domain-containing protein [Sulfitobacter sp. 1A15106]|uniref:phage tail sheath subtilisin-like domain-containing protein n=1 Tax=Sulfitobacter sp. 1A15106 TaxID=3368590 RepID=UPI0037473093
MAFLHGVEVIEVDTGARPIRTVRSGVIGIVGTAPDADAAAFPLNTPVLIAGNRTEAAKLDAVGDGNGTLPGALDGIFDQIGAVVIVVRVDESLDEDETLANIVGGVNAGTGQYEGVHALAGAESVVGHTPRILCAPGWTHQRIDDGVNPPTANPVVAELEGIAARLRAVIVADGPNTNDTDAQAYAGDWGTSGRVYVIDPWVKVMNGDGDIVVEPASARVAGVLARTDNDAGFWHSPSNKGIFGIVGTARPVDFKLGDAASRANLLNENNVTTIIRQDGFRLWGNRVPTGDPKWQFISVRRTADILHESLQRAHMWAVDRNITKTYLEDVADGVNGYIAQLVELGALLGGRCFPDPDLNTPAAITEGKVYFNLEFTPPYPAEHITFRSHLVDTYITEALS